MGNRLFSYRSGYALRTRDLHSEKNKKISGFLLLLFTVLIITIFNFLYNLNVIGDKLYSILLPNALLFLFLIINNLLYIMNDLIFRIRIYLMITALLFVLFNTLSFLDIRVSTFFYMINWIPYLFSIFDLSRKLKNKTKLAVDKSEREVAKYIIDGKKYREIGEELFISLSTVKKHANNIYRKTGTKNGKELIRLELISRKS